MTISADKKRVTVTIRKDVAEKISFYAEKLNKSENEFMTLLLESAIEDQEWVFKVLTSKLFKPVQAMVNFFEKERRNKKERPDVAGQGA